MTKLAVRHASTILRYVEQGRKGGTEGGRGGLKIRCAYYVYMCLFAAFETEG